MKASKIFTILLLISNIFANEIEQKQNDYRNTIINKDASTRKTYDEPSESKNTKNWNNQNWKQHLEKNGVFDVGLIGNAQNNTSLEQGDDLIHSGNPNMLSTSSLREQDSLKENKSLSGYSNEIEKSILDGNNDRYSNSISLEQSTKCYIAREMPVRFKCSKTGLIYGGDINSAGVEAQQTCESECYEQYSCVDVTPKNNTPLNMNLSETIQLTEEAKEIVFEKNITNGLKISDITFMPSVSDVKQKLFLDVILTETNGNEKIANRKYLIKNSKQNTIRINSYAEKITLKLYKEKDESVGSLTNIVINFIKDNKFICPTTQDLSGKIPGEFAYLCPSGKIKTFNTSNGTYKICEDYGVVGDNKDGTFSTQSACSTVCKDTFPCAMDTTAVSTNSLANFREGCIEGQANCKLETCRNLRISNAQVINENVFYGDFEARPTVVNGALISGIERPRILLDEDVEFQTRSQEEWKDGAYSDMINKGSYRVTASSIKEDTEESNAYNLGITSNSIDGTATGSAVRTLYWALKPKALDANTGKKFYFFSAIEVYLDNLNYDQYGNTIRTKDRIIYVKTSEADYFKPIAVKRNYAQKTSDGVNDSEVLTSYWEYSYFSTAQNRWYTHSPSTKLEFFKQDSINMKDPFMRIPIVNNYNMFMYNIPGLIKKIVKNGYQETPVYTGEYDGTGQAITSMRVYVKYLDTQKYTYQDVVEMIESGEWKPIYNNSASGSTPNAVVSDTQKSSDSLNYHNEDVKKANENIEIFMYGEDAKKTAFTRVKPKEDDVGKKAFIYIFAQ